MPNNEGDCYRCVVQMGEVVLQTSSNINIWVYLSSVILDMYRSIDLENLLEK